MLCCFFARRAHVPGLRLCGKGCAFAQQAFFLIAARPIAEAPAGGSQQCQSDGDSMKKYLFTTLLVLAFSVAAVAAPVQQGPVSFDVPKGWSYNHNTDAQLIAIFPGEKLETAPAVVTINYHQLRDTVQDAVEFFSSRYKAEKSVKKIGDNVYTFNGSADGLPTACRMTIYGEEFVLTCTTGNNDMLATIAASVTYKGK